MNIPLLIVAGLCGLFSWKAALWVRPHAEHSAALRKGILVGRESPLFRWDGWVHGSVASKAET